MVHDLPAVGSNLQDHPLTGVIYRSSRPVPRRRNNHGEAMGVLRTAAEATAPDLQILFVDSSAVIGLDMPDTYLIGVCAMQPHSRGSRPARVPRPRVAPIVDPNYLGDERDMATMLRGFGIAREIGSAPALEAWRAEEMAPGPRSTTRTRFATSSARPRRRTTTRWEPARWVRPGNPWSTVSLRVHGISGLRVVDASVMPSLPSNNTLATVYAIAERGAELIRSG